jgi:hypothetical protein
MRLALEKARELMRELSLNSRMFTPEMKEAIEMAVEAFDYEITDKKVILRKRQIGIE